MNIEILRITISVLIGTCLGLYANIALLFLVIIFIFFKFKKKYKTYFIILILVFLLVKLGEFKYGEVNDFIETIQDKDINIIVTVVSTKEEKEYTNKYIIKIKKWNFRYDNLKFILYTDKSIELDYGDIIQISGSLENANESRNYKGFDYRRYLRQNKIYGICNAENINSIDKKSTNIFTYIFSFRNTCSNILEENFNEKEASFLKGLLLGDATSISDEDKENFQKSNLAHIIAISGMHVVYIVIVVDFLLNKIIISKKIKNYIEILFLIFFMIFTGSSVSCMRSVIMMIMVLISKIIYRKNDFYSSLFFSFCFVLIYNPYNIESVGMWLSFLGTLGLMVFNKKIDNYILNNLYSSCTVQLFIFPVIVYCYNSISLTFFISNFFASFFIGPVLILGYVSMFFYKVKPLIFIENILINIILKISEFVSNIKFSNILVGTPNLMIVISYYIILICFINRKKLKDVYIKFAFIIIIVIFLVNSISYIPKKELEIHFLDVGQGDCTYIVLPNGKNILIDGGDRADDFDYGEKVVAPYLLDKNVIKIDYIIVSHFDSDHVGGLIYIVENFKVENILIGIQFEENSNLRDMQEIIKEKNINLIVLEKGNRIKLDEKVYIDVLFPIKNEEIKNNSINNNSLVFKLISENIVVLFTGDIEEEAEEKLVNLYGEKLKCDILKIAHHGSITSSIDSFIKYAKPKMALIGVRKR